MRRLCERPGCSEEASVAYGMRPQDLVFWLDRLADPAGAGDGRGVLCERHADSMVVPRNWTLDDLRDPDLHLFRPPAPVETERRRAARRTPGDDTGEQLVLGVGAPAASRRGTPGEVDAVPPAPWTPSFDADDDLDGLLAARSPLLARAFRGADRPRGS